MKRILIGFLSLIPLTALAGGSVTGTTITATEATSAGRTYISLNNGTTGGPSCATNTSTLTLDGSTAGGGALLANILSWYAMGKTISVYGTGTCTVSGYEDISYIVSSN